MALVKRVSVQVTAEGVEDAKLKIDRLKVAAEELKAEHPTITPKIDSARALLEARLLREGIKRELSGSLDSGGGRGGLLGLLSSGAGAAGGGLSSLLTGAGGALPFIGDAAGSNPYVAAGAIGAAVVAAGALLTEVAGLASGFAAATVGIGAFGLAAIPVFKQVASDASGLVTQWDNLQTAQNKLAIAQQNFNADPTKANKAALATAQRGLLSAQTTLQADQMGLGQDAGGAAVGVLKLRDAYSSLTTALQPQVFQVLNSALKVANTLLPDMLPFAKSAGGAIETLLGKVQTFFQSADFKKWLGTFEKLVYPAITAIGAGIGEVTVAVGKLFTKMSAKDVVTAIGIAFGAIKGVIDAVTWAIQTAMTAFDDFMSAVRSVESFITGGPGPGQPGPKPQPPGLHFHAAGGITSSGWSVVGETGPELVRLPAGSTVYPSAASAQMGGGGSTYNIYLPPVIPNPAEAGRQIVSAVRAFEQRSGKGWRS